MNRLMWILILGMMAITLTSCHKDKDLENNEPKVFNVVVTPASNSASFSWTVEFAGQFQTGVELSEHENMTDLRRVEATKQDDKFVAVVENLKASTQYYFRIVVWNKFNNYEEETKDFTMPAQTYTVSVSCSPVDGGTVTGGGTFTDGETCKVTATANLNYSFVNWTENGNQVSTEPEYTFSVTSNRTLVANFTSQEYTITATADPENGGTVSGFGGYNSGDECTLTATANEGYSFVNWTKGGTEVSTDSTFTFTATESAEYVAHFQIQSYTITVAANPENGGTIEGGDTYEYGKTCTVKATEANGYHFVNWTENGGQVSSNAEYTFTVNGNRSLVANFSAEDYIISVEIEPENSGTVTGAGGYNYGDRCTLTATPNEGYDFTKWTQNGTQVSTEPSFSFTVTESASYKAHFTAKSYTISASAEPSNGGNVTGGGDYHYGEVCTLTATAEIGYSFVKWTKDGVQISTDSIYSFTVTDTASYKAYFQKRSYTITISENPSYGGLVEGGGEYLYGEVCYLTASASNGHHFIKWTENGIEVSRTANYSFIVTKGRSLVAHFSPIPTGAINGIFSTNDTGGQVFFSQGNLQYIGNASTPYMKFADYQWEYLGNNGQAGVSSTIARDLFGWGTSGYNHGALSYQPWHVSTDNTRYYAYGSSNSNLNDQTGKADWGYNPIRNGGNQENQWYTLSSNQWNYVINSRQTPSGIRYAKAKVNGVNGLVLLPDDWTVDTYGLNDVNSISANYNSNVISASQWTILENAGAVFLPNAGYRDGQNYTSGDLSLPNCYGMYWSSTYAEYYGSYERSYALCIGWSYGMIHDRERHYGYSVRLVCPAQ